MRKINFLTVIISVILSVLIVNLTISKESKKQENSIYKKVIESGKIQRGYTVWEPAIIKDANTGELSGVFYDVTMKMAQRLGLEVEWVEEVSFAEIPQALKNRRFDVFCADVWPTASRGKEINFTKPLYYDVLSAFVKKGVTKFDYNLEEFAKETTKIATIDGEVSDIVAEYDFPKAQKIQAPSLTGVDVPFLNVATGKADLLFTDMMTGAKYMRENPGKIQKVKLKYPLRVYGNPMAVKKGEQDLLSMLDTALEELHNGGMINLILKKYDTKDDKIIRVPTDIKG